MDSYGVGVGHKLSTSKDWPVNDSSGMFQLDVHKGLHWDPSQEPEILGIFAVWLGSFLVDKVTPEATVDTNKSCPSSELSVGTASRR